MTAPAALPGLSAAALRGTVAVTGSTGLIGRRLVPALCAAGASVRVLAHRTTPATCSTVTAIAGDLRDAESLGALLKGADAVVHLAGIAHTALRNPQDEAAAASVNVGGTRTLLQAAAAAGTPHVVFLSSAHVYAGQQGADLREDDPKDPGTGYASMKLQAESLLHDAPRDMAISILRPCPVYGPGVRFNLHKLLHALKTGHYVHPGGADVLRSFASVDTVSAAVLHLLCRSPASDTYNVADRVPVSLRAWVNTLATKLGVAQPRVVPVSLLRLLAAAGTVASCAGLPSPLTTDTLRKVTVPFTVNLDRLAATGFVWPATTEAVLAAMVAHFQAEVREPS